MDEIKRDQGYRDSGGLVFHIRRVMNLHAPRRTFVYFAITFPTGEVRISYQPKHIEAVKCNVQLGRWERVY